MNILKLTPSSKDYLWGGSRLRSDFGIQSDLNPLAEAWVLSCHPDGPSHLPDGTTLADYRASWQRRCCAVAAEAVLKPSGGNCAVLP